jgi:K+-transporting ATPase A subunit
MTLRAVLQIAAFLAVLTAAAVPLGAYLQRVFTGRRLALERVLGPLERRLYAEATTTGSSGAVDGAMESLTAGGAAVGLVNTLTGETVFGGSASA